MPIAFNSQLSSAVANATWLDKTQDDTSVGILTLDETASGNSGATVSNVQREINLSRKVVFAQSSKANGDTISLDSLSLSQEARVIGAGAAVTLDALPFGNSKVVEDGCEIMIVGHDNTNTVTLTFNDVQYGLYINGNAELKRGYVLRLVYNDELERYIEVGRNF